jgi:hypothetical protein
MNAFSPIVSEFDSAEQAAAHDAWLQGKVAASLADPRATVAHDEAMKRAHAILETKRDAQLHLAC